MYHQKNAAIRQIELDEWNHRREVRELMEKYGIAPSRYYEIRFHVVGKIISGSCYVIGWFMPIYFAGRLESGNVCEYFRMMHYFHDLGITEHDQVLYDMGMKEKEHEIFFYDQVSKSRVLPYFERLFSWGSKKKLNDIDFETRYSVEKSEQYCRKK
jgi:hypothetical protein